MYGTQRSKASGWWVLAGTILVLAGCAERAAVPLTGADGGARRATSAAPCSGCAYLTGSITKGATQVQPPAGSYTTTAAGTHQGWLAGPAAADLGLELQVREGTSWRSLRKADRSGTSSESLSVAAGPGTYRWRVSARRGSGSYELWISYPGVGSVPENGAVATITVAPNPVALDVGQTLQLEATGWDAAGTKIFGATFGWSSTAPSVATVSASGVLSGVAAGTAEVVVTSGGATARVPVTIRKPIAGTGQWVSVDAGQNHTCGVQSSGAGYCWGYGRVGELGTGVFMPFGMFTPQAVAGGTAWQKIDGGDDFTCGLATSGAAHCWGSGWSGQLGNGVLGNSDAVLAPTPVVGGLTFTRIAAGNSGNGHSCGIASDGRAYCWGNNSYGQLGNGRIDNPFGSAAPVAVVGGLTFSDISVGRDYTCGITTAADLYCWGDDEIGQLGDDAGAPSRLVPYPVPVAGGHKWRAVDTGDSHACGVATTGVAYCWGKDLYGEMGLGSTGVSSNVPARIASAELFTDIGVSTYATCAVTTAGAAHCWGYNWYGTLGRGTKHQSGGHPTPAPVAGATTFAGSVTGGYLHMCALGTDEQVYCWGWGADGELASKVEFCIGPDGYEVWCSTRPHPVGTVTATRSITRGTASVRRVDPRVPLLVRR